MRKHTALPARQQGMSTGNIPSEVQTLPNGTLRIQLGLLLRDCLDEQC